MHNDEFVRLVKTEMKELESRGVQKGGDQFAIWFAAKILGEDEGQTIEEYHIGATGDNKLDIGILDDDHSAVIIAQCKFSRKPLERTFNTDLPEEAKNAHDRLKSVPEAGNEKRKDFAQRFARTDKPVRILAVGFGNVSEPAYNYAKVNKIEIYDFEKIKRRYIYHEVMEGCRQPSSTTFEIEPRNHIAEDISSLGLRQWILLVRVKEIYDLVREYQDGVFQMNLRFRLEKSATSGIGKEIYDTILSEEAAAFSILNNGLTLVAKRVDTVDHQMTLITPQIVNGCQTCWAIYDALEHLKNAGEDISQVKTTVLVKLVETAEDAFIEHITRTTNKQNPITGRDLHSKDDVQLGIANAFKRHEPKVFYDFRRGLWELVVRENQQSLYHIARGRYRKITNTLAGQLYLALLGRPYWAKQFKQKIFEDPDYYRVIFRHDLDPAERFSNDNLSLKPSQVRLQSQATEFVKDILFAYGISQLADALKVHYRRKLASYPESRSETEEMAYNMLIEERKFLTHWHFLLIGLLNHLVTNWEKRKEPRESLRKKLIGDNWDLLFGPKLADQFNPNTDLEVVPILDEDNPSPVFPLFSLWATVLIDRVAEEVDKWRERPEFGFRWFIDQRSDTFLDLQRWIDMEYAKGKRNWREIFPKDL